MTPRADDQLIMEQIHFSKSPKVKNLNLIILFYSISGFAVIKFIESNTNAKKAEIKL